MKHDLIGQRFGRIVVTERLTRRTKNRSVIWYCKCDCGNSHEASTQNLIQKNTASCGCLRADKSAVTGRIKMEKINAERWPEW